MLVIKNGIIHIGNGCIKKNYDILINQGIIEKIGQDLKYTGCKVIDASAQEVFPGFIDPVSSIGCIDKTFTINDQNETAHPVTPDLKIKYAFNHSEVMFEGLHQVGITTIGAAPGNANVLGGQMAAYKTWGLNSCKMLMKEPVGVKGSVSNLVKQTYGKRDQAPQTRMGIFKALNDILAEGQRELECGGDCAHDEKKSIVKKILMQEVPLFITANKSVEIAALLNLLKQYKVRLVICGAYQADRCLESIKQMGAAVVIGELVYLTAKNYNNTDLYQLAQLQKEGIPVSITLSGESGPAGKVKYIWNAIELYKSGVASEEVLKMMTINPAKMLGLEDRIGTVEVGKEANLVIYTSNPIENYFAKVSHTIIGGKLIEQKGGDS